jgi:hypothetical protein
MQEQRMQNKAAGLTAIAATTGAVAACAAGCVLPVAFPAIALSGFGGVLAWFAGAHSWMTALAAIAVAMALGWVGMRSIRVRARPAGLTIYLLVAATGLLITALAWPAIEPSLIRVLL